jgi:hypothetical protein
MHSVSSSAQCPVQPHPLAAQPHPFAVQHRPLAVSIISSLCSLNRPLKKLSAHSPPFLARCPLSSLVWSSVQPRHLAVQPLFSLFRFTTYRTRACSHIPAHYVLYTYSLCCRLSCLFSTLSSLACSFSTHVVYSLAVQSFY